MWLVFIELTLVVPSLFGCFSSPILVVPLYISFCMYPFPKWNMMGVHFWSSPVSVLIIVPVWHLLPSVFVFFYSTGNKQQKKFCLHGFEIEKAHMRPAKEKSNSHKVRQTSYFHQFTPISRSSIVFTNDSNPTSDPDHVERFQQIFPPLSAYYDIPLQMGDESDTDDLTTVTIRCLRNISTRDPYFVSQT